MKIRFTFGFFALWSWLILTRQSAAVCFLAGCILHELGHLAVMAICGQPVAALTFCCSGISLRSAYGGMSLRSEAVMLCAGCTVNFILAAMCFIAGHDMFGAVNMALGVFNLLPFSMLDGGRLIKLLANSAIPTADIDSAQRVTDIVFGAAMAVFLIMRSGVNGSLPVVLAASLTESLFGHICKDM